MIAPQSLLRAFILSAAVSLSACTALTAASPEGEPGFLDADGVIHAWRDYSGRLLGDRDRKRAERAEKNAAAKDAATVRGQSSDSPGKNAFTASVKSAAVLTLRTLQQGWRGRIALE